ncbi:ribonuclease H-like domain-containing protein [Tanacetum coccineum]
MHDPREPHFNALKCILRYVRGTVDYGLQLHISSTAQLTTYIDAYWAGFLLLEALHQSKYHGIAIVVVKTTWIRNLLHELHTSLFTATLVYCDNYVDTFTKGLHAALFLEFRSSLNIQRTPVSNA